MMLPLFVALACFTEGCASRRSVKNQKDAPPLIRRVDFEGISRFERKELLGYLQVKANSPWSKLGLADRSYLVKGRIREDKQRIVALYRSVGYYDAEVLDVRAEKERKKSKRVTIVFVIREGEPILVQEVTFHFQSPMDNGHRITKKATLRRGTPADVTLLNESKERMERALRNMGYVYGKIEESMTVDLEKRAARVRFEVIPGPRPLVGEITLTGLDQVPEDLVQREMSGFRQRPFTPALKKEWENKLLAMNVFSVVSVAPGEAIDEDGRLPINVLVVESNPQRLKLGIGVGAEPDKTLATINSLYTHRNLFGRLFGFEMRTAAGYATMPDFFHVDRHGPVLTLEPSLTKKGLLEKELFWVLRTSFDADIEEDYKFFGPTARLSVSRFFFERTLASLSYNFESYFVYESTSEWEAALTELYPDLRSPYLHGYIEAKYRIMLTDRLVDPRNGAVLELRYAFSDKSLGSDTRYNRFNPKLSLYWRIVPRLQLATRVEVGFLFPFGGTDITMQWSNFHLGGYNTVRGWGGGKLAPSVELCPRENDCETVRIGGRTMVLGNVEVRIRTVENLYVVAFVDGGDVQYDIFTFVPKAWNYSIGSGIRYNTPVGKLRFDLGYRLNNPPPYEDEPRWGFHLGLGEAF